MTADPQNIAVGTKPLPPSELKRPVEQATSFAPGGPLPRHRFRETAGRAGPDDARRSTRPRAEQRRGATASGPLRPERPRRERGELGSASCWAISAADRLHDRGGGARLGPAAAAGTTSPSSPRFLLFNAGTRFLAGQQGGERAGRAEEGAGAEGHGAARRKWQTVEAAALVPGDIVESSSARSFRPTCA